jgi:hypothetical protein
VDLGDGHGVPKLKWLSFGEVAASWADLTEVAARRCPEGTGTVYSIVPGRGEELMRVELFALGSMTRPLLDEHRVRTGQ